MNLRNSYLDQGYVVFKNLIPKEKTDAILMALAFFKDSRFPYFSQSIHSWIQPQIDSYGFMNESMENFNRLYFNQGLRKSGLSVLLGSEIHFALQTLHPQIKSFVQVQNMLFDKSTGTIDHYDSWYLDTLPEGYMTAAWVALEDISEGAGPFRVYPESHKHFEKNQLNSLSHDDFRKECLNYADSHECKAALLEKGDVLFWHPSLIHGSFSQTDVNCSRKSLTAHYYPLGFGKKHDNKAFPSNTLKDCIKSIRRPFYQPSTVRFDENPIFVHEGDLYRFRFNLNGWAKYTYASMTGNTKVKMDMRRASY